jgi:hypothetical protein
MEAGWANGDGSETSLQEAKKTPPEARLVAGQAVRSVRLVPDGGLPGPLIALVVCVLWINHQHRVGQIFAFGVRRETSHGGEQKVIKLQHR